MGIIALLWFAYYLTALACINALVPEWRLFLDEWWFRLSAIGVGLVIVCPVDRYLDDEWRTLKPIEGE